MNLNLGQWTDVAVTVAAVAHTLDKLVLWATAWLNRVQPEADHVLATIHNDLHALSEAIPSPVASSATPVSTPAAPAPTPPAPAESSASTPSPTPVSVESVSTPPAPAPATEATAVAAPVETPDEEAEAEVGHPDQNYTDLCLKFVRTMFGLPANGSNPTAVSTWDNCPTAQRHPFSDHMPANVPVVWSGGTHGAGHIAVSIGNGKIVSTDISGDGTVSIVPATEVATKWGLHPLGWIAELEGKKLWTEEYGH